MATQFAPFGLKPKAGRLGNAPNYQVTKRRIKKGYGTAIGFGDLVALGSSGNAGYVTAYAEAGTHILGVFAGCDTYFDLSFQQAVNKRFYAGTENPTGDINCWIIDDPEAIFLAQVGPAGSGPVTIANIGQNVDFGGNSAPNTLSGMSTGYVDFGTIANTATLPLRIVGISDFALFGIDPTYDTTFSAPTANNLVEVAFNTSEHRSTTGL